MSALVPNPRSCLVIERDAHIREFVCVNLAIRGIYVLEAATIEQAMQRLDQSPPAVIILELRMRDAGMNDWLLSLQGFHALNRIPLIAFTTEKIALTDLQAVNPNIAAVMQKPITAAALMRTVGAILGMAFDAGLA